ncbi:hypothetical protein ACFFX0_26835 [Citricoccus parietis]|uniref:Uncharacterized protein n=1 Tax=Citricoccus parietis TaxID=592307 RepID=A0ABV5G6P8_9MICC
MPPVIPWMVRTAASVNGPSSTPVHCRRTWFRSAGSRCMVLSTPVSARAAMPDSRLSEPVPIVSRVAARFCTSCASTKALAASRCWTSTTTITGSCPNCCRARSTSTGVVSSGRSASSGVRAPYGTSRRLGLHWTVCTSAVRPLISSAVWTREDLPIPGPPRITAPAKRSPCRMSTRISTSGVLRGRVRGGTRRPGAAAVMMRSAAGRAPQPGGSVRPCP